MIVYTLNLDYRCNERCVFCAADLGGDVPARVRRPSLSLDGIRQWFGDEPPGPHDRVNISGGEPTLHRELLDIARYVSRDCPDVALFTNGLRLAQRSRAEALVEAGIRTFEVSLFGAGAAAHDGVTRRLGSHATTLEALRHLSELTMAGVQLSVRLLVARHTMDENPGIVRAVTEAGIRPSWFDLNRAILSDDALAVGAPVSWADARHSVNATVRAAMACDVPLSAPTVPLCVFDDDVLDWVVTRGLAPHDAVPGARVEHRYLDPLVPADDSVPAPRYRAALPDVCLPCPVVDSCPRVERAYLRLFGTDGLQPVTLPEPAAR